MNRQNKIKLAEVLQEKERRLTEEKLFYYSPYEKQKLFHASGLEYSERCFMAGNQLGKTLAGAMEAAYHSTGLYPEWWEGKVFKHHTTGWACGETGEVVRDSIQLLLLGDYSKGELGTGTIPKDKIHGITKAMGTNNLIDAIQVKHTDGKLSVIRLKAYAQGRQKFQAATLNWIWFDEEPQEDIYSEGLTRTNVSGQFSFMTYTPLLGMSNITHKFYNEPSANQTMINMTIHDVDHYSEEDRQSIINSYPEHERKARASGIPILGSGRVYQVAEEKIKIDAFEIPKHFAQINGLDFGYDHPMGCVNLSYDIDADIIYLTKIFRERECTPIQAAATISKWGKWIPTAWPHDGFQHDKGSGLQLADQYRDTGLNMLVKNATHEKGGFGVEAGVTDLLDRMQTGRFKVFSHLVEWFEEFRLYHRENGKIVKARDDLLDATRYGTMMIRHAKKNDASDILELNFDSVWN